MRIDIYTLLGLVKDGKAPKKIKFRNEIYEYISDIENSIIDYVGIEKETSERFYLSSHIGNNYISNIFTDEVEILDEKPKPITKESLKTTPDAQIYLMDRYRTFMNLDKEVEIIEEPKNMEKWYLIYQYHDDHIVEFDDEDSLNDYLNTLKDTYKYDSDFKYKIIQGREMVE